jgi:hypothetical protein
MTIQGILSQLETTFGCPSATVLFQNNTTFAGPFNPMDTPETLFHRIEECQEIAVLGGAPYTVMLGGPAQKMTFFQVGQKSFLSVPIYCTRCKYDSLDFFSKILLGTCPLSVSNMKKWDMVGLVPGFYPVLGW